MSNLVCQTTQISLPKLEPENSGLESNDTICEKSISGENNNCLINALIACIEDMCCGINRYDREQQFEFIRWLDLLRDSKYVRKSIGDEDMMDMFDLVSFIENHGIKLNIVVVCVVDTYGGESSITKYNCTDIDNDFSDPTVFLVYRMFHYDSIVFNRKNIGHLDNNVAMFAAIFTHLNLAKFNRARLTRLI